jgi:hypothetical protein
LGFFGNKLTWRTGLLFKKEVVLMEANFVVEEEDLVRFARKQMQIRT